jgi:hypothetical protein
VEERERRAKHIAGLDLEEVAGVEPPPEELRMRTTNGLRRPRAPARLFTAIIVTLVVTECVEEN